MTSKLIIFVCTSNTCRSPMAEVLAKKWLTEKGHKDFTVVSRSLTDSYEPENSPASLNGIKILQQDYSLDMTNHRSKLLSEGDLERATVV